MMVRVRIGKAMGTAALVCDVDTPEILRPTGQA